MWQFWHARALYSGPSPSLPLVDDGAPTHSLRKMPLPTLKSISRATGMFGENCEKASAVGIRRVVAAPAGLPSNGSGAEKSAGGARTEAMRAFSSAVRGTTDRCGSASQSAGTKAEKAASARSGPEGSAAAAATPRVRAQAAKARQAFIEYPGPGAQGTCRRAGKRPGTWPGRKRHSASLAGLALSRPKLWAPISSCSCSCVSRKSICPSSSRIRSSNRALDT